MSNTETMTKTSFADYVATQDARNTIQLNVRKYIKVWETLVRDGVEDTTRSCWMFVDKKTGDVYKAATFKAPAKIVRYNLLNIASREQCFERADWAGGYLYVR